MIVRRSPEIERQDRAVELRRQGHTYQAIADILQTDVPTARRDVTTYLQAVLEQTCETPDQVRTLEILRLDAILGPVQEKAEDGDLKAAEVALKISARRADLLGLDAAKRVDVSHRYEELPPAERIRLLEQALAEEKALLPVQISVIVDE